MANVNAFANINNNQIYRAIKGGWNIDEANRGYVIVDYNGTGMMEVEFIRDMWLEGGDPDIDDTDAALAAERDGFCKIIPVDELPDNFEYKWFGWVDTPENRKAIENYCLDWVDDQREDVYEVCSNCGDEFEVPQWNPRDGFIVTCPYCGHVQHLCSQCVWHNNCDWHEIEGGSECRMGKAIQNNGSNPDTNPVTNPVQEVAAKETKKLDPDRLMEIIQSYVKNDLKTTENEYAINVLRNTCGCTDEEIESIGLGYLLDK